VWSENQYHSRSQLLQSRCWPAAYPFPFISTRFVVVSPRVAPFRYYNIVSSLCLTDQCPANDDLTSQNHPRKEWDVIKQAYKPECSLEKLIFDNPNLHCRGKERCMSYLVTLQWRTIKSVDHFQLCSYIVWFVQMW
jgi:hypothetical protein